MGERVKKVKVGDHVGVGCIVDSCLDCVACKGSDENYCEKGMTMTYNNETIHGRIKTNTGYTFGGYSSKMTALERYILKVGASIVFLLKTFFYINFVSCRFLIPIP